MALPDWTGDPPAVTAEMIVVWNKLADDVTAALMQGGEQGMDLLIAIMPEWVEAADDANTARQICGELARAGRRHEAILWHADGFFEAADRLTPERAGWEEWELALAERGIVVPNVDADLKDEVDRMHEELLLRDIGGTSLNEHLVDLRRNVISRGHYGERLTILEAIRGIDPTSSAWEEMIGPIRRKRAGEIMGELLAAIARDDFFTIDRLRREVEVTDWGAEVPGAIHGVLQATVHWRTLVDAKQMLSSTGGALCDTCALLAKMDWESHGWPGVLEQAVRSREAYVALRQNVALAMDAVQATPAVAARVAASHVPGLLKRLDDDMRPSISLLEEQCRLGRIRDKLVRVERQIGKINTASPLDIASWDEAKRVTRRWLQEASGARRAAEDLKVEYRMSTLPVSTEQSLQALNATERSVRERLKQIAFRERLTIAGVLIGVLLVGLVLVGLVVGSGIRKAGM